jgi:hypothetical protein
LTFFVSATGGEEETRSPGPLNVALAGDPKISSCSDGAALHDASVTHGGDTDGGGAAHGTPAVHS